MLSDDPIPTREGERRTIYERRNGRITGKVITEIRGTIATL